MHDTRKQVNTQFRPVGDLYRPIDDEMRQVKRMIHEELSGDESLVELLCRHVSRYQGKMLRAALLLLTGKACGSITPVHLDFAVVIELLHLATLIHDDVLDQAKIRRQSTTVNQLWGNEPSVLLGDFLLSKAFHRCTKSENYRVMQQISESAKIVCQGELLQCMTRHDWQMTEERYMDIIHMKTGVLYQVCCRIGASLAGGSDEEIAALDEYGRLLGSSFQIVDDLLDVVGREDQTGKTLGTDFDQAKPTLPTIHFCRSAGPKERDRLIHLLSRADRQNNEIRALLDAAGSLQYTRSRADMLISQARDKLQTLKASEARDSLAQIADFVVKRSC